MATLSSGTRVSLAYECKDETGVVLESVPVETPGEFMLGRGELLPALETVLADMQPGESCQLVLGVEDAFGPHDEELVGFVSFEQLPDDPPPEVGDVLELQPDDEDELIPALVVGVEEDGCLLDTNHPLAGKELHFELHFVAILD